MTSGKYLVFILLIGLSISILAGQELNQLSIVGKATLATGEIVPGDKLDANKNQAALVSFITDLEVDMDFRPWNGAVGKITNPAMGRWNVYVSPGERAIDVHAEGFEPLKVVLASFGINSIKSGDVYHLKITGDMKTQEVPVMINCNQSGAKVIVDCEEVGSTINKMLATKLNPGERKIRIEKEGFASQEISEDVSLTNYSFHFDLVLAMPAVVKITSDPEGATVTIDGNMKLGVTPLESFYDAGTYAIRIEKENYETINEQITISEPKTEKQYKLTDIRATLTVKTHPNATINFEGESYKGGVSNQKVAPQVLEIEVTMPKAETIKRVIALKPKAEEIIEMYPEVQTGVIQVMCIPTDAKIELTGDAGEHFNSTGRKTFTDVPVGKYKLIVSADGYKTHKEEFRLTADETIQKQVTLEEGSDVPEGMVFVEGGTFQMGSASGDDDEKPVHSVTLRDFYIGKYEVTQGEYESVMGKNPSEFKQSGKDAPVELVSWNDAVEYCNKLSDNEGLQMCYSSKLFGFNKCDFNANGYRLPSEAEWEYAAEGGNKSKGYKYAGSNDIGSVACYDYNSGSKTHPIGGKQANELGIHDMSGNVWEWCWDQYGDYSSGSQNNPRGSSAGSYRVGRGGSWNYNASSCRTANRRSYFPGFSYFNLGFRLVRSSK
ncbi:MAG: SUMF1/EgtB/PvdO family nonheme iron enzyme [Candidatus Stygibacter australis]|nr:SUMF1/EgtB/PvdO family nonheme iron enzyme [Candidatus Stygibacter australis]MDP8321332.1 SUMF1/EgtB/PvdO family nonheme iron enzyme [Candidatus Stygibacter australis]